MKVAVHNRYWRTGGGAEKVAAVIAEVLSADHDVELLGYRDVDPDWLGDRLAVDLSRVSVRLLDELPDALTAASASYDLLVNGSYMSHEPSGARHALYYVHFPSPLTPPLNSAEELAVRAFGAVARDRPISYRWGTGFHHREHGRRAPAWTNGHGRLEIVAEAGRPHVLRVVVGHHRPPQAGPTEVQVLVDGVEQQRVEVRPPSGRLDRLRGTPITVEVTGKGRGDPVEVELISNTFIPADLLGVADARVLGVPVISVTFGSGPLSRIGDVFPVLLTPPADPTWLESYDRVLSNSAFTRRWVDRYWNVDSEVLHPPVLLRRAGVKEPMILNAGRFFPADAGHSKKQLELVRAFRSLLDGGLRDWSLHLVGGSEADDSYVQAVRAEAAGLPVELHVNAPLAELDDLYARSSIYWHASGLGEDPEKHPDRFEHFGITTAEAMSAGCVPVVINMAGQAEIVRHGIDGYRFNKLEDLVTLTRLLIDDPAAMERFRASAQQRARRYDVESFAAQLRTHVEDITSVR